jgi:hypothetical protein
MSLSHKTHQNKKYIITTPMASWSTYDGAVKDKDGRPLYGMDIELAKKQKDKHNPERERDLLDWIQSVLGERFHTSNFQEELKDGIALCKLVNKVKPGAVKKINEGRLAYLQLENLTCFLNACKDLGLPSRECFATADLYESKNLPWVQESLYSFAQLICHKPSYKGPKLGVRLTVVAPSNLPQRREAPAVPTTTSTSKPNLPPTPQTSTTSSSSNEDPYAQLEKLADLKNKGIITEQEFSQKKKQLLGL